MNKLQQTIHNKLKELREYEYNDGCVKFFTHHCTPQELQNIHNGYGGILETIARAIAEIITPYDAENPTPPPIQITPSEKEILNCLPLTCSYEQLYKLLDKLGLQRPPQLTNNLQTHYLYGKSIQNCNWYLILQGTRQTIITYIENHPELQEQYHSLQITNTEIK